MTLVGVLFICLLALALCQEETTTPFTTHYQSAFPCYNEHNQPQRCVPEFVNAAFNRKVDATNTCGERRPIQFCAQSGHTGMVKDCDVCDARVPGRGHSAVYLTDFNNPENETWWQSETSYENVQHPNSVNITLNLGKAFDITYVRLKFHSPRPESFSIFKKSRSNDSWVPWQYYSASCRSTFGVLEKTPIFYGAETVAQCTSDYSDISPLTGADIAFSTLEGRPSAYNFENSPVLQDWVTAAEIRIMLVRLNTYGDEMFRDDKVLKSYYYAISDFAVGGRCKCNGHASECVKSTGVGLERLVCRCEHFTTGEDCDQCMPFYNDHPWKAGTADDAYECKVCDCNGLSTRCYFDESMFSATGSGGHCVDCAGNTRGTHCEGCLEKHWRRPGQRYCTACNCNEVGSLNTQCNDEGMCICKPGVTGQFCDRCLPGYYEFSAHGCKNCGCIDAGSLNNQPNCRADSGDCACKANVEGKQCDRCRPSHFHLDVSNQFGCTPCFCHGHSSICDSAAGYYKNNLTSDFNRGIDSWKIEGPAKRRVDAQYNERDRNIATAEFGGITYFLAPERFLGNQRHSYNQNVSFKLRVADRNARASTRDLILQGANGQTVSLQIFAQENNPPDIYEQVYTYRLHEDPSFQWTPRLTSLEFISLLSNLTDIKIRATYSSGDSGFLDDFTLGSAGVTPAVSTSGSKGVDSSKALWVESCSCPEGFIGQNCESCGPGYRRDPPNGGPFARCIKCECHEHSNLCEAESGRCICQHNTTGDTCERCAKGYYGNALKGTIDDCQTCPCPNQGPCILHTDNEVICTECAHGYAGRLCEICADGYYGDPKNKVECKLCECSSNIDPNSIGNCDRLTGECKKCIHNTNGFHCEKCSPGFYGDALIEPKGDCKRCNCFAPGTYKPQSNYKVLECHQNLGQCQCLPHVTGRACDICEPGYFNISSAVGCQACNCDALGSVSGECDPQTGQCRCKPGILGLRCDVCQPLHFGFGAKGCHACDCLPIGALSAQCDPLTGQCQCRSTVEGRQCDQCMENKFNLQAGCLDCDPCYALIQKRANKHRAQLAKLNEMLADIMQNPTALNDTNFETELKVVMENVEQFAQLVTSKMADAHDKLKHAQEYLENEGSEAWNQAKLASDTYGQQSVQLTAIAEQARQLAAKHKNDSATIGKFAQKALNASKQAEKGAVDAVYGGQATSQEISRLKQQFLATEKLFNETEQLGEEHRRRAETLHQQAAGILNKVEALKVPTFDANKITKESADISEGANDIKDRAENLARENKDVVDDAKRLIEDADQELKSAGGQQKIAAALIADLEASRHRARLALETAENTLKDASETLKTLNDFDALVQQSKGEAKHAMGNVPVIEKTISEAENKSQIAEKALGSANLDASNAQKIANEAQTVAAEASKDATYVKEEASRTKSDAKNLNDEAAKVEKEALSKAQLLQNYRTNANQDKLKAQSALTEASAAENAAKKANETASGALDMLKQVLSELNSLDGVNDTELEKLDGLIDEAEKKLKEGSSLENNVVALKALQDEQSRKIAFYSNEIEKLTSEVKNIEQIKDSLPADKCFNVVSIEGSRRR